MQTSQPSGQHAKMITCGICFKVLKRPVSLPCGDAFCYDCVSGILARNGDSGLNCPMCTATLMDVDRASLSSYMNNDLESYINGLARGTYTGPQCNWCEDVKATVQCFECMCTYCNDCSLAVHKSAAKKSHTVGGLTDAYKTFHPRCVQRGHEEYKAEFFCTACEEVCCAYCLQVGPHKDHPNVNAAQAATEVRQRFPRELEDLGRKTRDLESQAGDLNRTMDQYTTSYDNAENVITERFESFRQQLMQYELEVRKRLTTLRDSGDVLLTATRKEYLSTLNAMNASLLRLRCLHEGGPDSEVLASRSLLNSCAKTDVPRVSGSGFRIALMGDLSFANLDVELDLRSAAPAIGAAATTAARVASFNEAASSASAIPRRTSFARNVPGQQQQQQQQQRAGVKLPQSAPNGSGDVGDIYPATTQNGLLTGIARSANVSGFSFVEASKPIPPETPLRLTFPVDEDIEATVVAEGVQLRCVSRGSGVQQIGVRSKEVLSSIIECFPEDKGIVSWQVRLDAISDTFMGIVEKTKGVDPEGFYWKPACANMTDGAIGRVTTTIRHLPVCRNGDIVRFIYDGEEHTLRVVVNGVRDMGIVVSELHPHIAACFIFYPGEALTILF